MSNRPMCRNKPSGCGWTGFFRRAVLLEAGAAILFFGVLIHHPELTESGSRAIVELSSLGYTTPTASEPVKVYPATTGESFSSWHAGGWYPGVISLREIPEGSLGADIYLRHELMHEASYRTCGGRLPIWAEEAAAMHFSGELSVRQGSQQAPDEGAIDRLRKRVRIGARLSSGDYDTLARLVLAYGWPEGPCAISGEIGKRMAHDPAESGFSYILIHLLSGRVLEYHGDITSGFPPGSLLKIPYAASLTEATNDELGQELARSDTGGLLQRQKSFDPVRFHLLTSMVKKSSLPLEAFGLGKKGDEGDVRMFLGERDRQGDFPFEAGLDRLALVLRASLLSRPERFSGLAGNGILPRSTLFEVSDEEKMLLKRMHALCKTGTVSDMHGNPLTGHLMVAWPQEAPLYLAVFRRQGSSGSLTLRLAADVLKNWYSRYTAEYGRVDVRLLTLANRSSWEIVDECPGLERPEADRTQVRFSTCGWFKILSTARGSRTERFVRGGLQTLPGGDKLVLQTDPETYADAVLASEAGDLHGEAARALRAVIVWNGVHGSHRHPETKALCDTTHCMVFQGSRSMDDGSGGRAADPALLGLLDRIAREKGLDWFLFSEGGVEQWERRFPVAEIKKAVRESAILDIRRERTRSGETVVHLIYPETEERVPCEVFRASLKLPSCPDSIEYDTAAAVWSLRGIGRGHSLGLSVETSRRLARSGYNASAILQEAYGSTKGSKR
jgi:hypothetical protein